MRRESPIWQALSLHPRSQMALALARGAGGPLKTLQGSHLLVLIRDKGNSLTLEGRLIKLNANKQSAVVLDDC